MQSEIYIEVLQNFLYSPEWRQSIEMFVMTNCHFFHRINELTHAHHGIWRTFQDIVENILESTLMNLGGSLETLEKAIDEVHSVPSRGPRDDLVKDVLEKLQTFSDFSQFASMMHKACINQLLEIGLSADENEDNNYDTLLKLGFSVEKISELSSKMNIIESPLEDLVMQLSELSIQNKAPHKYSDSKNDEMYEDHAYLTYDDQSQPSAPYFDEEVSYENEFTRNTKHISHHLLDFAKKAKIETADEIGELQAKFMMAETVLDTFGTDDQMNNSIGMSQLLKWADDMTELYNDILQSYKSNISFDKCTTHYKGGLIKWYFHLEDFRKQIDEESIGGNVLSDSELQRMAELDRIAATGTQDEQLLHGLISRHDTVSREINGIHNKCGLLVSKHQDIKRENIEELYLYLKEQVASGSDLESISDELHENVYNLVSSAKGAEIVHWLLDLHLLEDEQYSLKQKINEILSEMNSPKKNNRESSLMFAENADHGFNNFEPNKVFFAADSKTEDDSSNDMASAMLNLNKKSVANEEVNPDLTDYLENLKGTHKTALHNLRSILDAEKANKLKDLEERLLRRKMRLSTNGSKNGSNDDLSPEEIELREAISNEIKEIEEEINTMKNKHDTMVEGMVSGFKKKCLAEVKIVKEKAKNSSSRGDEKSLLLSALDQDHANREAADGIKKRFERDQLALLESLEADRKRQKNKVLIALEKRKNMIIREGGSDDSLYEIERKGLSDLQRINQIFDEQEAIVLSEGQEKVLLALSAIYIDDKILQNPVKSMEDDDEDGDYLDEQGSLIRNARPWLSKVEDVKSAYLTAGKALQQRLRNTHSQEIRNQDVIDLQRRMNGLDTTSNSYDDTENDETNKENAFSGVTAHMMKVITEAFDGQISEVKNDYKELPSGNSKKKNNADMERLKAGIIEEFEKAKNDFDSTLRSNQLNSKSRLNKRMQQRGNKQEKMMEDGDNEDARAMRAQEMLESVVDMFLDDPLSVPPIITPEIIIAKSWLSNSKDYENQNRLHHTNNNDMSADAKSSSKQGVNVSKMKSSLENEWEKEEQARIKGDFVTKEKELEESLLLSMRDKKKALEERLKRKKEQSDRVRSLAEESGGINGRVDIANNEEKEVQNQLHNLEN
eukprot:gene5244-7289_t